MLRRRALPDDVRYIQASAYRPCRVLVLYQHPGRIPDDAALRAFGAVRDRLMAAFKNDLACAKGAC